jgi:hypothetical protein
MDHDGPEPRGRTLILFGIAMALVIVTIIGVAAALAAQG